MYIRWFGFVQSYEREICSVVLMWVLKIVKSWRQEMISLKDYEQSPLKDNFPSSQKAFLLNPKNNNDFRNFSYRHGALFSKMSSRKLNSCAIRRIWLGRSNYIKIRNDKVEEQ